MFLPKERGKIHGNREKQKNIIVNNILSKNKYNKKKIKKREHCD